MTFIDIHSNEHATFVAMAKGLFFFAKTILVRGKAIFDSPMALKRHNIYSAEGYLQYILTRSTKTKKSTVIAVEGSLGFRHTQVTYSTVVSTKLNTTAYKLVTSRESEC